MARYWKVTFSAAGKVVRSERVPSDAEGRDFVIVEAGSEAEAVKKALRRYARRKKQQARARLDAAGNCRCGRPRDSIAETGPQAGREAKQCSVCLERQKAYHAAAKTRPKRSHAEAMAERDEAARLEKNVHRQRDRRAELRIETLLEVRTAWRECRTVGAFTRWLEAEIAAITQPAKPASSNDNAA